MRSVHSSSSPRQALARFRGDLILPGDPRYDAARTVFNARVDRRPAVIARPADERDVADAIAYARSADLPLAIRGGGHGITGAAVVDDGVVLDMRDMRRALVDVGRSSVRAQPGLTWAELDARTQRLGLAVTGGRVSSTGIVGFTIGSGSGWLERTAGLASDNLVSARVVTADGRAVRASAAEHADLFWALHGGGGNFGVVTELELALHRVGPTVLGGMLLYPAERAAEALEAYRDFMRGAPESFGGGFAFLTAPATPSLPRALQGRLVAAVIVLHDGPMHEGTRILRRLRLRSRPAADLVGPMPYTAVQRLLDRHHPAGMDHYHKAGYLHELSDDAVETAAGIAATRTSASTIVLLQPLGGALDRFPERETALTRRDARWGFQLLTSWDHPGDDAHHVSWTRRAARSLQRYADGASLPNFVPEAGHAPVRAAYGEGTYERLAAVKQAWDPENVFRRNPNVQPAGAAAAERRAQG